VWHEGAPFSDYEETNPRFVSEFGYQSFPSTDLLRSVIPEEQLNPTAPLMEHHQRNDGGNGTILSRMADHFRVPYEFDDFVYLSQIQQGLAMETAIEHWRRLKPSCMGTLYWQLNDLWPCASWSSIEYGGGWKALQYVARRIFAPVLVTTVETDDGIEVWLVSDKREPVEGTLSLSWRTLSGEGLATEQESITLEPQSSNAVATVDPDRFVDADSSNEVFFRASFDSPVESYPAYVFFSPYKHLELAKPSLDIAVDGSEITLSTDDAALFLELAVPNYDGTFSDNYFHLLPGQERVVTFDSPSELTDEQLSAALDVRHLQDTY